MGADGQGGRSSQQPAGSSGDALRVHAVSTVLVGTVGAVVVQAVAIGQGVVHEHVVRRALAQVLEQADRQQRGWLCLRAPPHRKQFLEAVP